MANRNRPLSPFMLGTLYRLQITSVMSLMHRVTGIVASVGAFGLAWWLLAVARGGEAYASASDLLASPLGMFALAAFSLALVYHLLNGIRHLLWDIGWGFELPEVYRSGYAVVVLTFVLTAAIWFVALRGGA
ncbi:MULTISPECIES: succinate dehydrogenase, cytochrome b556 subunit [Luteimonas]|uniref:Succinate dehydrogenase cytochrome b556 subunit n=1 Tax=Luteimonas chenhongjianii TaxID=2006110 RepID=A0A290XEG3_9GAMM|nr:MULTISPECIES: succinate dehydrogenase, cytochrome b556 subunit [Luteimonas]ATD67473.1 succinate dehydrogenase, cytochrome b556 subunit [Luteimonas chenhongjianii]RPD85913.1 succinate dehydrogenase, cytochrome b556 subunit [Luteimonas sp. 100069]